MPRTARRRSAFACLLRTGLIVVDHRAKSLRHGQVFAHRLTPWLQRLKCAGHADYRFAGIGRRGAGVKFSAAALVALTGLVVVLGWAPTVARAAAPFGGTTVQVNQDPTTLAQNETTIAINPTNPRNLVAGSITNETGAGECAAYSSTDRGKTWTHQVLPNAPGFLLAGDPVVAFDLNGTAYFLCMNLMAGNVQHTQYVYRSIDGGQTWLAPVIAIGTAGANTDDKGHLAVDDHAGSPFVGNVYVANTRLNTGQIRFARSTNGGLSFLPDQPVNDADIGFPANIAVGADGAVYVSWARELPAAPGTSIAIMIASEPNAAASRSPGWPVVRPRIESANARVRTATDVSA